MADDTRSTARSSRRPRPSAKANNDDSPEEVTRCICRKTNSTDVTMIQCDRCNVWQHVPCMLLNPARLPNEYLCEQCAPQNHEKLLSGNVKKRSANNSAPAGEPATKKRMTMNSLISEITDVDSPVKQEMQALAPDTPTMTTADTVSPPSRRPVSGSSNGKPRRDENRRSDPSSISSSNSMQSSSSRGDRDRARREARARNAASGRMTEANSDDEHPRGRSNGVSSFGGSNGMSHLSPSVHAAGTMAMLHGHVDEESSDEQTPQPEANGSPGSARDASNSRRMPHRGRAFHKDMSVAEMLKRSRAIIDYLSRSRRDLTHNLVDTEVERLRQPSDGEQDCLKRIAELEGRVAQFQHAFSSRSNASNSAIASSV